MASELEPGNCLYSWESQREGLKVRYSTVRVYSFLEDIPHSSLPLSDDVGSDI